MYSQTVPPSIFRFYFPTNLWLQTTRRRVGLIFGCVLTLTALQTTDQAFSADFISPANIAPSAGKDPPTNAEALFQKAVQELREGRPDEALSTLQPLGEIEQERENPFLWYLRGAAHHQRNEPHEAMDAFDRALDSLARLGEPDSALARQIRIDRLAARRKVFVASLQVGTAFDSNVTFRGGDVVDEFITGREDVVFGTSVFADFAPLARRDEELHIGVGLHHNWHASIGEFNDQEYDLSFRYTRHLDRHWDFHIQYSHDFLLFDNQSFLSNHALSPGISYRWPQSGSKFRPTETVLDYRIEYRDFLFPTEPDFDRDGRAGSFGVTQSFSWNCLTPKSPEGLVPSPWNWDLLIGYRLTSNETQGSEYDRLSNRFLFAARVPLRNPLLPDKELAFRFGASWDVDDYQDKSLVDRRRRHRDDLITTLSAVLSQTLLSSATDGELILHGIFQWTDADSDVIARDGSAPYTYDKIIAGLQLEWRF